MFGQNSTQSSSPFGQTAPQTGSMFGQTGQQPGSMFGQNVAQTASPSFGNPGASTSVPPSSSLFGTRTPGGFGTSPGAGSGFGSASTTTLSSMLQQNPQFGQSSAFSGKGVFGQTQAVPSTGSSMFGQGSGFTGSAGAFGQTQATSSGTAQFGQGSGFSGAGPFGQPQTSSLSGASGFGQSSGFSGSSAFGQAQSLSSSGTSSFGQGSGFSGAIVPFGQPQPTTSTVSSFGQGSGFSGAILPFGQPQPPASTVSSFGQGSGFSGAIVPFGQPQSTTSTVSSFGQGSGFSGVSAFGQPMTTTTATSVSSLFGHKPSTGGEFSPVSTASPGLFGQPSPSTVKPVLFGQTPMTGQGQTTSTATPTLFGQPSLAAQTSSATTTASQASFAFVKSTASAAFGSGGSSAFQSTASAPPAFGQSQSSARTFGKSSPFSQQQATVAGAVGQPNTAAAGLSGQSAQPVNQSAGFSQQTTAATATPFSQTSAFGQPASTTTATAFGTGTGTFGTGGGTFGTGGGTFGTGGGTFGTSSDVKPSTAGLFGKGQGQSATGTVGTTSALTTSAGQSRPRLVSGGFTGLFGKKEKAEGPRESTEPDQKPALFGKPPGEPAVVKQEPQSQTRLLFGKGPPDYQEVVTVKQEKPRHAALFGKPAPTSEPEGSRKAGLFGKGGGGGSSGHQAVEGGEDDGSQYRGFTARQAKVREERQTVSQQPQRTFGLFGKGGPKPVSQGLFGKQTGKADSDRDTDESSEGRGFRPRLPRVGEDTGSVRSLFGKPVTQSTRQSRGSDESLKARRGSFTRQVSEDRTRKVAIICKDIPTKFNNNIALRNHFCRYGKVTKVFPNPSKMQATIHFDRHEQAADAKRRGRVLARGYPPLTIFWSSYLAPLSPSSSGTNREQGQGPARRTDDEVPSPSRQSTWHRGDPVSAELQGMSGTRDLNYDRRRSPSPGPWEAGPRSPEKRVRSASPAPGPAMSADVKTDKVIQMGTFHGLVAKTTTERVHLLDLRDKYIRQNKKSSGKDMKKKNVGTCPDMCPEKERYNREDKRQLSYYEMVPGTENIPRTNPAVDHSRAVKEYLRSSPDQDEPLPHELRPLPVLQMTMTYLLREIADQGQDGYWADWFDFLWNRTRGIRKDITQQQLCDRHAAELIEKCARFHIFCSERLCEEDMHSFDAKINNENLTKCLQTLREFYHDLERKQKVYCPCEAEFRAYTVLMNLNGGDILREVQQLRPEVRSTPEIKFAIQVYSALNSNNYVRFFRLMKQSSFSCACIMHRYFTQVRNRALTSMMRTYGMGNKPAQIPLLELVRLLGFESEQEASDFAEHYGFIVEDACVILDKNDYVEPDTAWLARRSVHLIESKRMVSVGEMINGEALPQINVPPPSSSFDEQGRFKSAVELPGRATATEPEQPVPAGPALRGQIEVKQEPVAKAVKLEPTAPPQPQKPAFTNEHVKDTAKLLFWEVIDRMCQEIGRKEFEDVQTLLDLGQDVLENTVYSTVTDIALSISREVLKAAQTEHQRALKQEREARCDRVAEILKEELLGEVLKEQVLNLTTIEIREVKAQLKKECIARVTEEINRDIVQEVMSEMVQECGTNVHETDVVQRLRQLQELEGIVKLSRAGKYFKRWKKEYKAVTKLKRAMMEFPSAPSMDATGNQLDSLVPHRRDNTITELGFYVNQTARLTIETPVQVEERRKRLDIQTTIQALYQRLRHSQAWLPLDMGKLVGTKLVEKYRRQQKAIGLEKVDHLYWKLVLYLPEREPAPTSPESRATALLSDWLKAKLSKGKKPPPETVLKTEVLSLYKTKVAPKTSTSAPASLGVCVRSISGLPTEDELLLLDEERCMLGTCGIVFVLPANPPIDDPYSEYWYTNLQRLQELLEVKPSNQDFPLVIIVAASANQDVTYNNLSERLNLDLFIEQGFICDVKVLVLEYDNSLHEGIDVVDPDVSEKLCECMEWLSDLTGVSPSLNITYLKDCIDTVLMEHYYTSVLQNLRKRKILGHLHQTPEELLELYNTVVQHLCDTLTSESLLNLSWPVAEFTKHDQADTPPPHWNTEDQFEYLSQLIGTLKLPNFVAFLSEPRSWESVKGKVNNYVNSVVDGQTGPARITLFSRLNKLLQQVEVDFEDTCYLTEGLDSCEPTFSSVPWTDLVSMCIDYRLATLDFIDPCLNTQGGKDEELKVAYFQSELDNFVPPHAWRHIESEQSILESQSVMGMIQSAVKKVRDKVSDTTTSNVATIVNQVSTVVNQENEPPEIKKAKVSSSLIKSLQAERRRSDHFQKFLENAIKSDQEPVLFKEPANETSVLEQESRKLKTPKMIGDSFRSPIMGDNASERDIGNNFQESEWKSANTAMFGDSLGDNREFSMMDNDLNGSMGTRLFGNRTIHFNDESCFGDREITGERKRKSFGHPQQNAKRFSLGVVNEIDSMSRDSLTESQIDIATLSSKARKQRLSDIYGNDKVMLALCEPSVDEGIDSLQNQIKRNRRESDLFEEKLLAAMKADPFTC